MEKVDLLIRLFEPLTSGLLKRIKRYNKGQNAMQYQEVQYRAGLADPNHVSCEGRSISGWIKSIKRQGNIDCRKLHKREVIFSEFREHAWGVFFWNRKNGSLDAWIEFERKRPA